MDFIPKALSNKNLINITDTQDDSLTKILCTRSGMRQMRKFFNENNLAADYITNSILLLQKEKGLIKVFNNVYGNYFIQDLITKMNKEQIQLLLDSIFQNFVNIAKNCSGTHCLQAILNHVKTKNLEISILNAIKNKEIEMAHDNNATHVLQKILSVIVDTKRINLNEIIIKNIIEFSLRMNSSYVVKKFMETTTIIENKNKIIEIFTKNCVRISQSPFGNYVIQYTFEVFNMKDCYLLVKKIISKAVVLICHKYSVNIIDRALDLFNEKHRNKLINILCNNENILLWLNNQNRNYILNKIINHMENEIKKKLASTCECMLKDVNLNDYINLNKFLSCLKEKNENYTIKK